MDDASAQPALAIVVPAWNAARQLEQTLPAMIKAAGGSRVLVVDAGSTDDTSEVAERFGADVLRLPERQGPAGARNAGTAICDQEVVLFIDADCLPQDDVAGRVREAFAATPDLVSVTGSYDEEPHDRGFFSLYMNLRHHHVHQGARREKATFWAGCGAVRRSAFEAAGGFDARRYPRPMIEDIELGTRLAPLGRMQLDPELQVKHLKRWTLGSVVRTDIVCRAIPWTRVIMEQGQAPDDLNLKLSQRVLAALAPFALLGLAASPALAVLSWVWALLSLVPLALAMALGSDLLGFFRRREGSWFALRAFLFHLVHLVYSAVTYVLVALAWKLGRRDNHHAETSA
ncbi:MAG: glycosyltransferase family 2 protein [Planctomycetes bacterium]|nr:glycosyltransferase family 2 protein [Planctomycetota bacterium]